MILKLLNFQILYRYKTAYLWKDCFEKEIPNPFIIEFKKSRPQHSQRTRSAFKNCDFLPKVNTVIYGEKKSIIYQWID